MFLLVLAHLGYPGQNPMVLCVCVLRFTAGIRFFCVDWLMRAVFYEISVVEKFKIAF